MTRLQLVTFIHAPKSLVFDLSRDMDVHMQSAVSTGERIIEGRKSGLLGYGEKVRFEGRHFGCKLRHTSQITALSPFDYFVDEMTDGRFRSFRHEHVFRQEGGFTRMEDVISYEVPFGWLGQVFDRLLLRRHLTSFLLHRNLHIKKIAEQQTGEPPENRNGFSPN